ncbi:MAG: class I SAM-dependent methyltransferase [Paracoccaceae bacterium]
MLGLFFSRKKRSRQAYRQKAIETDDPSRLVAGTPQDRTDGLKIALDLATNASVLDLGCHDGTVAAALVDAGAKRVDGMDISPAAIEEANRRFSSSDADVHFQVADLTEGFEGLKAKLRQESYDMVCYLGVHHHLTVQLKETKLEALESKLFSLAEHTLVARTPQDFFHGLEKRILASGFEPLDELQVGSVGTARTYKRSSKSNT